MTKLDYTGFGFERETASDADTCEEFNSLRTPHDLENKIQCAVDSVIRGCEDVDWSEDLITFNFIKELRNILMEYKLPKILEKETQSKFNFEAYKLTGKAEQSHGDIAFIVTRKILNHKKPVSGVAFYEAKASSIGYEEHRYPSFDIQQLRRLVTHTPKLSYLIYSKEDCSIGDSDWPLTSSYYNEEAWKYTNPKRVNALTIDANFLKQLRNIDAASFAVGQSFGSHFVTRVLSGRDLDYSRSVEQTIRRWIKLTKRTAPLVVSVSVFEEGEEHFSTQLELPGFEKLQLTKLSPQAKKLNSK